MKWSVLIEGVAGRSQRGFLGWSTVGLVRATGGVILFDTGATGDRVGIARELQILGLRATDIDVVVLSHAHFDHAANVEVFDRADIVIQRAELAYAQGAGPEAPGLSASITAGLASSRLRTVDGDTELERGVTLLACPGHTPGSMCMLVEAGREKVLFAGDTVKTRSDLPLVGGALSTEVEQVGSRLTEWLEHGVLVVPGHDVPHRRAGTRWRPVMPATCPVVLPFAAWRQTSSGGRDR